MMKVLVAEDDPALSLFLQKGLELEGHTVVSTADGATALEMLQAEAFELLVLDLGLPKLDGVELLRSMDRLECSPAVLVLTGRTGVQERIDCLDLGADDFLTKPFSLYELLARCRAVARRRSHAGIGILSHGPVRMDRICREVKVSGQLVEFTTKEFSLLEYLLLNRGRPVSRRELLQEVWRMPADAGTNVVDVYVNYLRRKLSPAELIQTVRGDGYAIGASAKKTVGRAPVVAHSYPAVLGAA